MYTTQNTTEVLDAFGNVVDFTSILNQYNTMQVSLQNLQAQMQQIYNDVPAAVPQDIVKTFNLQTQSSQVTPI